MMIKYVILSIIVVFCNAQEYLPPLNIGSGLYPFYDAQTQSTINTIICVDYQLSAGNTFLNYGTVRICNTATDLYIGVYSP